MEDNFSEETYQELLRRLFTRFKSFQTAGREAYHPGLEAMEVFDSLLGRPERRYRTIHVAGTNGKGSVSNMLAVALASLGLKVGLYTSPHLLDVRERIRVLDFSHSQDGGTFRLIPRESLYRFCREWEESFDHLHLSFFEITTALAFKWFADERVDIAVIETGLGGRLDSTNVITPLLSVVTNIGLDHCDLLGDTLPEIAFEKAGIIKRGVPVVVGESGDADVESVFRNKVIYTNAGSEVFTADRNAALSLLHFADREAVGFEDRTGPLERITEDMDLRSPYRRANLRTALKSLEVLAGASEFPGRMIDAGWDKVICGIRHTAALAGFHGRWEQLGEHPAIIADIGHNPHGLAANFRRLAELSSGQGPYSRLIVVYGTMADKDWHGVMDMIPPRSYVILTAADSARALPAAAAAEYAEARSLCHETVPKVADAVRRAVELAVADPDSLIYIGGSAFVVAEAEAYLKNRNWTNIDSQI